MHPEDSEESNRPANDRPEDIPSSDERTDESALGAAVESTQPDNSWLYSTESDDSSNQAGLNTPAIQTVSWTASEFVSHQKSITWFMGLGAAIICVSAGLYFLTRDRVSAVLVFISGAVFGVFAARQPRVLEYTLNHGGLQVGPKFLPYERFKSFSIIEEGPIHSILLMPLQRFMPPLTIYYDPNDEENIVNVLGSYLPHEDRAHDMIDRLMRKIRF